MNRLNIKSAIESIKHNCNDCFNCEFIGPERCNIMRYPKHWDISEYNGPYKAEVLAIKQLCVDNSDCRKCVIKDVNRTESYFCRIMNIPKDWDLGRYFLNNN